MFIVLLSLGEPSATKYLFLNDEPCMVGPTLIDMTHVELKYYPFTTSLNKFVGSVNVLSSKIIVPKETEYINIKGFTMIKNRNANTMAEHISCDCTCKFTSTICNSNQKWNDKTWQSECNNYCKCKKDSSNPSTCICENSKYSNSIADNSETECDKIIVAMDIVSTKKTNAIVTNVKSTASINCHNKKVRDCYITIDNYYYLLLLWKTKMYNIKWKTMNFKKFVSKAACVIISMS